MIHGLRMFGVITVVIGFGLFSPACAQAPAEFFKDKTLTINVGYGAGGGYDMTTRIVARHLGRHIPGNPTVIVSNMPGGGSLRVINFLI